MPNLMVSWLPKLMGLIALIGGILAATYADAPAVMVLGLPAFKFFGMITAIATGSIGFVARQDNKSSEQVGAGIIDLPPLTADQKKALIAKWGCDTQKIDKQQIP